MSSRHSFLSLSFVLLFLILLHPLFQQPASAQMDWLKSGKQLLESATGTTKADEGAPPKGLTSNDIASGLKEALQVGTERVVEQLGQTDGFNTDPAIHIPLPESMRQVKQALSAVGLSAMLDDLELKLNRAAEEATVPAKKIFWDSIKAMSLDDVMSIYNGPDDAATRYFQDRMSAALGDEMQPIVEKALNQVGAIQAYDAVMGKYSDLPFVPNVKNNLNSHVVAEGMNGIFHYIALEEKAIRQNPVNRTTDILKKVFGANR